ncbi:MAG: molecular chaperone HtpG [Bacteroidota bacterium]|jgi:molecular chaperone HtpG
MAFCLPTARAKKNQIMTTGKINVQTENIFPIIKKFLYSDHEIFLRELVANAVDATGKIKTLTSIGENKTELGELSVEVIIDKDNKTLTIRDRGLGMTAEEVEKYINQIAFSGAEEFVNKYKDQTEGNLIGKFGLGFYSGFMVSDKVEIYSRSFKAQENEAIRWTCDGSPDYTMTSDTKADRGTDIILHINEDSLEFLEEARIKTMLDKYCRFLPTAIKFKDEQINNPTPAWVKKPSELQHEDYLAFYKELYPMAEDPLFYIHLNVDFPFNLTGILYFPKLKKNLEVQKNKIQLYCRQVFVTDSVEGIVPEFLTLLHGVIDSPDIPLNVSRSYLQSDSNVKKISNHILKKVSDKLEELFKENRTDFEAKWDDIGVFIKYGMLSEEKFYDRAKSFCLLKNTDAKYFTFDEYKSAVEPNQTDKDNKLVYTYTSNLEEQYAFVEAAKNKGYDVLQMDGVIDSHFVNFLEYKLENTSFVRVDADTADNLIKKEDKRPILISEEEQNAIKELTEKAVEKEKYFVQLEGLSESDAPALITRPEFMRRMKEMAATGGGYEFMGSMGEQFNLIMNANHPLMKKVLNASSDEEKQKMIRQAVDLAMLSQGLLKGEALSGFIRRSVELI